MRFFCFMGSFAVLVACAFFTQEAGPSHPARPFSGVTAFVPSDTRATCEVTRIVDGDTVEMTCQSGWQGNVRLVGYDTPETYRSGCAAERALGERAKSVLRQALDGATVIAPKFEGIDRYDRPLAALSLDGVPLADVMISENVAVTYSGGRRIDWCRKLA